MPAFSELYAALDLGSNSFHLLIAHFAGGKMTVVDRHKDRVRFAAGLNDQGYLDLDTQQRALASLARMAERLRNLPRERIRVVGTNTLRAAANAAEFLAQAERVLGVPINIISGTEEARLIYLGIANDFSPHSRRRMVVDIGGGSTEIVVGMDQPDELQSLPLGCVTFSQRFFACGLISDAAFERAVKAAQQELSPHVEGFRGRWQEAVGSSGTIRAVGRIAAAHQWSRDGAITPHALQRMRQTLTQVKHTRQLKLSSLSKERAEVFPAGLAILTAVMQELEIPYLMPSQYALREGVLHDLAGRFEHRDTRVATIGYFQKRYQVDQAHAGRIASLAVQWLESVRDQLDYPYQEAENLLHWAAQLHEIGLSIAHDSFHKHGAYILQLADMPGFSRQEQARLAFLVLNQRRKPRQSDLMEALFPNWLLVSLLRLACLFYRRRQPRPIPSGLSLSADPQGLTLTVPASWSLDNPLTAADLEDEVTLMQAVGFKLSIVTTTD